MAHSTPHRPPAADPNPKRLSAPGAHLAAKLASSLARAEPGEIEAQIEHALQIVGRFLDIDVISLCPFDDQGRLRPRHEWRTTGWMDPSFLLDTRHARWWTARTEAHEDVIVNDVGGLGGEAVYERALLAARGTRSLMAVGFGERGTERGYIVAETLREARSWISEEVTLLSTFAGTVTSALVRNNHHQRLLDSARQAESASTARNHFIAMLAHELRTPLTAIIGYTQMLDAQLPADRPPQAAEYIENILQCTSHVTSLITDTLDLARIDSGQMPLDLADLDVRDAMEGALIAIRPRAMSEQVALEWTPPAEPVRGRADSRKLQQLVINLLANAVKLSREHSRVVLSLEETATTYEIAVQDFGPGIAPRDRERIFESFARARRGHDDGDGAGLGLSLVHRLCELHGGHIELDTEVGQGARFTARLPKQPRPAAGRTPYIAAHSA